MNFVGDLKQNYWRKKKKASIVYMPHKGFSNLKFYTLEIFNEILEIKARTKQIGEIISKHKSIYKIYYLSIYIYLF
jgi:hypothetical protein